MGPPQRLHGIVAAVSDACRVRGAGDKPRPTGSGGESPGPRVQAGRAPAHGFRRGEPRPTGSGGESPGTRVQAGRARPTPTVRSGRPGGIQRAGRHVWTVAAGTDRSWARAYGHSRYSKGGLDELQGKRPTDSRSVENGPALAVDDAGRGVGARPCGSPRDRGDRAARIVQLDDCPEGPSEGPGEGGTASRGPGPADLGRWHRVRPVPMTTAWGGTTKEPAAPPPALCLALSEGRGPRQAVAPWHFLYLRPDPHGHGALRPTLSLLARGASAPSPSSPCEAITR
jgi:hypothetical protein